ncbi:type VII secretion protein EccB [Catellatospora coxensis]
MRPETAPGTPGSATWLITDIGVRYPMSDAAVAALGYSGVAPVTMPATLLALVPAGPLLDPAAAAAG